jgi:hypothetical protein
VILGVGDGIGVGVVITLGVGDGVGDGVGIGAGAALLITTPLFQRSFFFFLIQVYFFPLYSEIFPTFEQEDPGFIGAAEIALLEETTRAVAIIAIPILRFTRHNNRATACISKPDSLLIARVSLHHSSLVK